jgi:hypothetical protein
MELNFFNFGKGVMAYGPRVITPLARIAFPKLDQPSGDYNKYGCTLLFDKADEGQKEQLKKLQAVCVEMADLFCKQLFKEVNKTFDEKKYAAFKAEVVASMAGRPFLKSGDTSKYEDFHGMWVINPNSKNQPVILDGKRAEDFKSGVLVRAEVQPAISKQGYSYGLIAIRLVKDDGKRFGGTGSAAPSEQLWGSFKDEVAAASESTALGEFAEEGSAKDVFDGLM